MWLAIVICVIIAVVPLCILNQLLGRAVKCTCKKTLEGKSVIITGATSGVGKAAAVECAKRGARLTLACRDKVKAEAVKEHIVASTGNSDVYFLPLDLASQLSVKEFVELYCKLNTKLDVLVNNAAYMGPRSTTEDGHDQTLAVNYLGHFLLTNLLLRKQPHDPSKPIRVVNLASDAYSKGDLDLDILINGESAAPKKYDIYGAYAASKLAMVLFTIELSCRFADQGIVSVAVHPGAVSTGLMRNWPGIFGRFLRFVARMAFRSPEEGAQTVVHCAVADEVMEDSGKLFYDCHTIEIQRNKAQFRKGEKLWEISEDLCDLQPDNRNMGPF